RDGRLGPRAANRRQGAHAGRRLGPLDPRPGPGAGSGRARHGRAFAALFCPAASRRGQAIEHRSARQVRSQRRRHPVVADIAYCCHVPRGAPCAPRRRRPGGTLCIPMLTTISSFSSLYLATLLMLIGTGLFNTYMGLRLTAESVSEIWVGALIAGYYLGLVCGARMGHKLIIRVGHIRAFVACAAISTSMILAQILVDYMPVWLLFRLVAGVVMVTELMVIESWLNEQTENHQRGRVFSVYMVVSGLGTVLGQLALTAYAALDQQPLILVAGCLVLCLVPIAVTARSHPPTPLPAPLDLRFFFQRVPLSMTVLFVAGNLSGAFYGLAPVYAAKFGMTTSQAAVFVAAGVTAGLLSQWPMGWLSDRINRAGLIRFNAFLLTLLPVVMWGWLDLPFWLLVLMSCVFGVLQFTLYPLGAAFANDHVESERRVG